MSTYTTSQIRAAILRAADRVQNDSASWAFSKCFIPSCGTPGCALGWIGFELGFEPGRNIFDVGGVLYPSRAQIYALDENAMSAFYRDMGSLGGYRWNSGGAGTATALRAYADKYFPADKAEKSTEQLDPAFTAFKAAFARTMEEA